MSGHANFIAINRAKATQPTIQQHGEDIGVSSKKSVGGASDPVAGESVAVNNDVLPKNSDDDVVKVDSKTVGASYEGKKAVGASILHLTEGYFRRDIMSAVAKPGWFDEDWPEE